MGLFKRKKEKTATNSHANYKSLFFVCTEHFRGYKRYRLTTYGYEPTQRGIDALKIPNPKYKVLFDASRKVKPDDIEFVKQLIDRMGGNDD